MTVSQIGYSNEDFYAVLSSPFITKKVSINSYTQYNKAKPATESFSRNFFPEIESTYCPKLQIKQFNVGILDLSENSANIVKNMITQGYSTKNALDTKKAIRAYGLNAMNRISNITKLNNMAYQV